MDFDFNNIDKETAREIIWDDHPEFEVVSNDIIEHTRWSIFYMSIVKHKPTDKFYQTYYQVGATEMQYEQPFDYDDPEFVEVVPTEQIITVYRPKQ